MAKYPQREQGFSETVVKFLVSAFENKKKGERGRKIVNSQVVTLFLLQQEAPQTGVLKNE